MRLDEIGAARSGQEGPDAFMLAGHDAFRRRLRIRGLVTVPLAVVVLVCSIALPVLDSALLWVVPVGLVVIGALAVVTSTIGEGEDRPRPDTAPEVGRVVSSHIATWRYADRAGRHQVRIVAEPVGSGTRELVHGHRMLPADGGAHLAPGGLVMFRRYPTMRHLVWLDPPGNRIDLAALVSRAAAAAGRTDPTTTTPPHRRVVESATVRSINVGADHRQDHWKTTVTVRTSDGILAAEVAYHLPEDLARFEPGRTVQIVRDRPRFAGPAGAPEPCIIVPEPA